MSTQLLLFDYQVSLCIGAFQFLRGWKASTVEVMPISYPPTRRTDHTDHLHGRVVADPYRWLEDETEEVAAWVASQSDFAAAYLADIPGRAGLVERMTRVWDFPRWSVPSHRHGTYVFGYNDGLADQPVLYRQVGLDGEPEVLLDPNTYSDDGAVAVTGTFLSPDGRYMAFNVSEGGSDFMDMHVLEVGSGVETGDVLDGIRFGNAEWSHDNGGFYYPRYPDAAEGLPANTHMRVFYHRLGTERSADELVYERPDRPGLGFSPQITDDGRYLVLSCWDGTASQTRLYVKPLAGATVVGEADEFGFYRLFDDFDAAYHLIHSEGSVFFIHTNRDAPRSRVMTFDVATGQTGSRIAENVDVLEGTGVVGGKLIANYLHDAYSRLAVYELDGTYVHDIDLPAVGTVAEVAGRAEDEDLFVNFQSHLDPPTILRYSVATGTTSVFRSSTAPFDRQAFVTRQVFATADDGVQLPIFLTHHKDLELPAPTVMYGYGGFNIAVTPTFSPARIALLEARAVFASTVIRGGSEFGETWHTAGMLTNKQRVFDDFVQCGEFLVESGVTTKTQLGIFGGSNGGLLTAVCVEQRPDLFGAVVSAVPVTDMLRFHRFGAGRYWTPEYGNAQDDPELFEAMVAYSPLHNVDPAGHYPPTLITTAEFDDRVVPLHSFKWGAAMQAASTNESPVLIRIDRRAGHGLGKPTSKQIEEAADIYGFFLHHLRP